jgi:hypothetical protein
MFGLEKTFKHNFIFVFVNECERVSFIKKSKKVSNAMVFGNGV